MRMFTKLFSLAAASLVSLSALAEVETIYSYGIVSNYTTKDSTVVGGTVNVGVAEKFETGRGLKLDGDNSTKYVKVTLANDNAIKVGDVVTVTCFAASAPSGNDYGIALGSEAFSSLVNFYLPQGKKNEAVPVTYTVSQSSPLVGLSEFFLFRCAGKSTYFVSVSISRDDSFVAPTTISPEFSLQSEKAISLKKGETSKVLYTSKNEAAVKYTSSNEKAVTVSEDGVITAVGVGSAVVTVSQDETETYYAVSEQISVSVADFASDATTFVPEAEETTVALTRENVEATAFISTTEPNWGSRTIEGVAYSLSNMSGASRTMTLSVQGLAKVIVKVQNSSSSDVRNISIKVGETATKHELVAGAISSVEVELPSAEAQTIVLAGDNGSVYPFSITLVKAAAEEPVTPEDGVLDLSLLPSSISILGEDQTTVCATLNNTEVGVFVGQLEITSWYNFYVGVTLTNGTNLIFGCVPSDGHQYELSNDGEAWKCWFNDDNGLANVTVDFSNMTWSYEMAPEVPTDINTPAVSNENQEVSGEGYTLQGIKGKARFMIVDGKPYIRKNY